ncbi:MAG: chromosome segregation protein SMC, partial [Saprospiraceae bacterium]
IADLLMDASKRTQLVVTTHSDVLIDALSEQPESVLICEKHDGQTRIKRLNREDLDHWLTDYSLGQLWIRGEIGAKRW